MNILHRTTSRNETENAIKIVKTTLYIHQDRTSKLIALIYRCDSSYNTVYEFLMISARINMQFKKYFRAIKVLKLK